MPPERIIWWPCLEKKWTNMEITHLRLIPWQSFQWVSSWAYWLVRRLHGLETSSFNKAVQGIAWWVLPREVLACHYLLTHGILYTSFALNLTKIFFLLFLLYCPRHPFCPSFSPYLYFSSLHIFVNLKTTKMFLLLSLPNKNNNCGVP